MLLLLLLCGGWEQAVFQALSKTYGYLTPDLWPVTTPPKAPYQEHTDFVSTPHPSAPTFIIWTGRPRS